jgi:hypothetical protein
MSAWGCFLLLKWFMRSKKATYNKCQSGFSDKNFIGLELCAKKSPTSQEVGPGRINYSYLCTSTEQGDKTSHLSCAWLKSGEWFISFVCAFLAVCYSLPPPPLPPASLLKLSSLL